VAVVERVRILTPKDHPDAHSTATGHWHRLDTIPANLFSYTEPQNMCRATIADVVVDRKDRFSPIRRASWSPLGIGLHKPQVLAVLTKNWLLSISESDGTAESRQRTCIVNHLVNTDSKSSQQEQTKIRAFSWVQPPPPSEPQKQLSQCLIIVDDTAKVSLVRIRKSDGNRYRSWECSLLHTYKLSDPSLPADAPTGQRARH
jgi:hypothetical protein